MSKGIKTGSNKHPNHQTLHSSSHGRHSSTVGLVLWSLNIILESVSKHHSWQSLNLLVSLRLREKWSIINVVFENTCHSQFHSEGTVVTIILNNGHQFFLFYSHLIAIPFTDPPYPTLLMVWGIRQENKNQTTKKQKSQLLLSRGTKSQFSKIAGLNLWQYKNQSPDTVKILHTGLPCNKGFEHQYNTYQKMKFKHPNIRLFFGYITVMVLHKIRNLTYYLASLYNTLSLMPTSPK